LKLKPIEAVKWKLWARNGSDSSRTKAVKTPRLVKWKFPRRWKKKCSSDERAEQDESRRYNGPER
jgi:hypothetical protein